MLAGMPGVSTAPQAGSWDKRRRAGISVTKAGDIVLGVTGATAVHQSAQPFTIRFGEAELLPSGGLLHRLSLFERYMTADEMGNRLA